jgi:hypothetical protein
MRSFAILRSMGRKLLILPLACLAALLLSAPAGGQDDVFVDPDSPTGSEYDIPLERARRDASTDRSEAARSYRSRTAPLFGEGIDAQSESGPRPAARSSNSSGKRGEARGRGNRKSSSGDADAVPKRLPQPVRAAIRQPGAPGDSTAQLAGLAGALLVGLGVIGGLVLRRSRRN